jgi:integrase
MDKECSQKQPNGPSRRGKLYGQKRPLKAKEIWEIRMHLEMDHQHRDLAMFNLGIDSKLRGCDLLNLRVHDVMQSGQVLARAVVMQRKTQRPVKFELTEATRTAVSAWIKLAELAPGRYLFPGKKNPAGHVSSRQYARVVDGWVESIGLDPDLYGTHTMRRTKPTLIYQKTKNIRAVQLLLGHTKVENTVRYLGIEVDDALEISEQTDI